MNLFGNPSQDESAADDAPEESSQEELTSPVSPEDTADEDYDLEPYLEDLPEEYRGVAIKAAKAAERRAYGKSGEVIRTYKEREQEYQNRLQQLSAGQKPPAQEAAPQDEDPQARQIREELMRVVPELKKLENLDQLTKGLQSVAVSNAEQELQRLMGEARRVYGKYLGPYEEVVLDTVRANGYQKNQAVNKILDHVGTLMKKEMAADKAARLNRIRAGQNDISLIPGDAGDVAVMHEYNGQKTFDWHGTHRKASDRRSRES